MSKRALAWSAGLAGLLLVVGLPLAGHWMRRGSASTATTLRCALDGVPVDPHYQVSLLDPARGELSFCSIRCAEVWISRQPVPPNDVRVTDESSGQLISARDACFVRSTVVTTRTSGNRIHAFRERTAAQRHAAAYGGQVLEGSQRPFSLIP